VRSSRVVAKPAVKRHTTNPTSRNSKARQQAVSAKGEAALSLPVQAQVTEQPVIATKPSSSVMTNFIRVLALLAVVGITIYIYSIRDHMEEFKEYGYFGIFLVALLANATILLPAPGVAIVYAMGGVSAFNPIWVGLAAGTGGALGELSGYLAGFSGQAVVERTDIYNRIRPWVDKYGGWAIMVLSAIPNPFFDVAGIAAGIAKMPIHKFLLFTWVGQLIKMTLFALAGNYSIELLNNFMR